MHRFARPLAFCLAALLLAAFAASAASAAAVGAAAAPATPPSKATAAGTQISGIVARDGEIARLASLPGAPTLVSADREVESSLRRLSTGDFLLANGSLAPGRALIESIDAIGLKALLGRWRAASGDIFEFANFNRINLYFIDSRQGAAGAYQSPVTWSYTLSPCQGKKWAIFLGNDASVMMGELEIVEPAAVASALPRAKARALTIQMRRPDTLAQSAPIALTPIDCGEHFASCPFRPH
jgi:hypothetical protein